MSNITLGECIRIVKHQTGNFEADVMLSEVRPVLCVVPFKGHCCLHNEPISVYVQLSIYVVGAVGDLAGSRRTPLADLETDNWQLTTDY